jgi:hypothetical protein
MPPVTEHRQIAHIHPIGQSQKASGIISDLNLPIISPLCKNNRAWEETSKEGIRIVLEKLIQFEIQNILFEKLSLH